MFRIKVFFLMSFLLPLLGFLPLFGFGYYVDAVNGDDITGDGSFNNPWKTVTYALTQANGPLCTLEVRAGVYDTALGETFPIVMKTGIAIQGSGVGETILRAGDPNVNVVEFPDSAMFGMTDSLRTVCVEGGRCGVEVFTTGLKTQPRIFNCSLRDNALDGIRLSGDNWGANLTMVHANRIYGNGQWGVSVYVQGMSNSSFQIHKNAIHDNGAGGVGIFVQDACAVLGGTLMNKIYDNGGDGVYVLCDGPRASATFTLQTNMIYDNDGLGVCLIGDHDGEVDPKVVDNTIVFQSDFGLWIELFNHATTECIIANNIFWKNNVDLGGRLSAAMVSHCIVSDGTFAGENFNFDADPLFVDEEARDFHIQMDSPAVDAGDNHAPGGC